LNENLNSPQYNKKVMEQKKTKEKSTIVNINSISQFSDNPPNIVS